MKRLHITAIAAAALLCAASAPAQAPPPITMKQLKPDVWAGLGGAGGNSTIIIGKTGVIVVDAKQTEAGAKDLLAEIAKITPKPVTTAIITHSDGDHVNGLVAFPAGDQDHRAREQQEGAAGRAGRRRPRRSARRQAAEPGHDEEQGNDDDRRREARAVSLRARRTRAATSSSTCRTRRSSRRATSSSRTAPTTIRTFISRRTARPKAGWRT